MNTLADLTPDQAFTERLKTWEAENADRLNASEVGPATISGLATQPVYTRLDLSETKTGGSNRDELPGEFPFTRGIYPGMYREQLWVMGQYSGYGSPEETNRRIRSLIEKGQKGFSIALDLPTQNGLDSDDPLARGEVGRVGVPIDTLADMEDLLARIPLDQVRQIRTTANAIGPLAIAFVIAAAEKNGYSPKKFRLLLQNDILKEYVARGTYVFPPRPALEFSVDAIEYCARNLPHWEPIEFCGYHLRDSGATAVQELSIAIANGIEYITATLRRGLTIDEFAGSLYMFLSAHLELFEEVAKFRAARRIWAHLMKDRFHAERDESCKLNLFVYTLGSPLTAQEPLNNIARVAYEALAAILGGVQTLACSSYDEAGQLPSEEAAQVSLRTQQILAHELGVTRTSDPLGGSYFVESLTDQLEHKVYEYLGKIEAVGGGLAALEEGWIASELEAEAYRYQQSIERGERVVVGVNRFATEERRGFRQVVKPDPNLEQAQVLRLNAVRERRDNAQVASTLDRLRSAAEHKENTIPYLLDTVRAYASVGEICKTLKLVWGEYKPR